MTPSEANCLQNPAVFECLMRVAKGGGAERRSTRLGRVYVFYSFGHTLGSLSLSDPIFG